MARYVSPLTGDWVELRGLEETTPRPSAEGPTTRAVIPNEKPKLVDASPEWHAEEIARLVARDGVAVFWSEAVGEMLAFVRSEAERAKAPAGIVAFTVADLESIFAQRGTEPVPWKILVEGKRAGARILTSEQVETRGTKPSDDAF